MTCVLTCKGAAMLQRRMLPASWGHRSPCIGPRAAMDKPRRQQPIMNTSNDVQARTHDRDQDSSSKLGVGMGSAAAASESAQPIATNAASSPHAAAPAGGIRYKHVIDLHKGLTVAVVLLLMALYDAWHLQAAWAYLAMHGTYGLLWVVKSNVFPDKQFERAAEPGAVVSTSIFLSTYWIAAWLLVRAQVQLAPWYLGLCIAVYTVGMFLMFTSDMQKHMHLTTRRGQLLCDGLWARCRNPNYLGELMTYGGFFAVAKHPVPLVLLALTVVGMWMPNMRRKDASLARYPEFAQWKARSALFIPGLL